MRGPTNYQTKNLLSALSDNRIPFWRRIAKDISKSARRISSVNVYKIEKFAREGETIVVPGKVLSVGTLSKKVDVAALNFSEEARRKIEAAKGKTMTIHQLLETNPEAKKVRILG